MSTVSTVSEPLDDHEPRTSLLPQIGRPQVLLVDDDAMLISALRRRLQEHFDIHLAHSARDALTVLQTQGPMAVVVADMTMPGMDGATLLGEVKRYFPNTVRLMLTGSGTAQVVDRAVNECEVFRFLSKPCRPADLDRALEEAVRLHYAWGTANRDATALAPPMNHEAQLTRFDMTTGLPSRHSFELAVLSALGERSGPSPESVLVHLDIDNFRLVNEGRGLGAGDAVLRHVAHTLREALDTEVPIARLWADEFGVLLRGAGGGAEKVCKRLLEALADSSFHWDGERLPLSMCAGAVRLSAAIDGVTSWLLLAESACGVAQQLGPGRIHVGAAEDPQLSRRQKEREWVARTQRALEENQFRLMFQRIVPLQGPEDGPAHFELLLRMQHESGSLLSPAFFMPIAERYHLAGAVDRWVIRNAFEWLAADAKRLRNLALCSINLSGASLCDAELLAYLLEMQEHWRVPAEKVCLEITETAAVNDIATAAGVIQRLRGMGFRFALDDFGSGLCSFGYLKHLDVDFLKIDGSFVKQLDRDRMSRSMVQSINDIGQITGKKTVAEFVENPAIANILRRIGVDFGQGYGIHAPAPLETFS